MTLAIRNPTAASGVLSAATKIGGLLLIVVLTFLSVLAFGLVADGHDVYSADHRAWRDGINPIIAPAIYLGGAAMWGVALTGGRNVQEALKPVVVATLTSILLMQLAVFSAPGGWKVVLVLGGSFAAVCFAARHKWVVLLVAIAPFLALFFTIAAYFAFAPPNDPPSM